MGPMLALEGMSAETRVSWLTRADRFLDAHGAVIALEDALAMADAVIALRVQRERMTGLEIEPTRYARAWQLDAARLARAASSCRAVLHPGPVSRGMKVSAEVADGPLSLILQQVRAKVAVRQALLAELVGARADDGC